MLWWLSSIKLRILGGSQERNRWLSSEIIFSKACGIDTSDMDEVFDDYQAIYDKTVEMQGDKEVGRKESGRGRVR